MASRWASRAAVRRDDDFTAAPRTLDGIDSDPLDDSARWHGPASHRTIAIAVGLLAVAGIASLGYFAALDVLGGPPPQRDAVAVGDQPGSHEAPANGTLPLPSPAPPVPTAIRP